MDVLFGVVVATDAGGSRSFVRLLAVAARQRGDQQYGADGLKQAVNSVFQRSHIALGPWGMMKGPVSGWAPKSDVAVTVISIFKAAAMQSVEKLAVQPVG